MLRTPQSHNAIPEALVFVLIWAGLGAQPGHSQATPEPPTLISLRVVPEEVRLSGREASQQVLVLGQYSDGLERDLTAQARFSVAAPRVASVDGHGRILALSNGWTTLTAQVANGSATSSLSVHSASIAQPFSFQRDIGGILTKWGCNNSSCHAGVKGRGGLKLSLSALNPREDYAWIVEGGIYQVMSLESAGPKKPRINPDQPEKSLLLLKPTLSVPHGGGERFTPDSPDYRTLLNWIKAGAPFGEVDSQAQVNKVVIFPREGRLAAQGTHQILVTAHLSDGRTQDLTHQAFYESSNQDVLTVNDSGQVKAVALGETSVIIRTAGHMASARFGVISTPLRRYEPPPPNNFVDDHVFDKLRRFNIPPSQLSTDAEFLRRVCLDLTGTLPPPDRVREFLASRDSQKREKLIDILLDSPEYVDFWTFRFGQLFRVAAGSTGGAEHGYVYWHWVWQSIASNKSYRDIAFERLAAQGYEGPSRHFLPYGEEARPADIMPEEMRVFLGRRLDCAQCHNHPYEQWNQDQFWGLAAFFGQISRTEWTGFGATVLFDDPSGRKPDFGDPADSVKVIHPRRKQVVEPAFPDGRALPPELHGYPRRELASWMTSHPYFAETLVNRMWGHLFGHGLVDPVDDFRSTNPPTHPDLLKALAEDFRLSGYDLKQLLRRLTRSRTYQLSSSPADLNRTDRINYSHFIPKPLEAEVLLDAISQVTGVPEVFENGQGGQAPWGTRAIQLEIPDIYPSDFLEMYGRPSRLRIPEINASPSLNQALHMLVGTTYTDKISKTGGRLDRLITSDASHRTVIQELYLAALSRFPSTAELTKLEETISQRHSNREAWEDLLWSLISSREFAFNH